jgi:carbon-monoxide dehydrogenase medium subunit
VKPAPFAYHRPDGVAAALALKAEHGEDAYFLAGGQSLVPAMNFRLAQPAVLIDVNGLDEIAGIASAEAGIRIGALTRYRAIERSAEIAAHQPLVAEALAEVAHPQIRTRGTLGGNLAHADPASEMPAVVLALGGSLQLRSLRGERRLAAADFFLGPLTTALAADEMLVAIELPALPRGTGTAFLEVARRRGDYAMMGVAAVLTLAVDGRCTRAALAYCNAGGTPMAASGAAASLVGAAVDEAAMAAAAALAEGEIDPGGGLQATAAYQRHLAGVLTRRALRLARDRALQEGA